MEQLAHLCRLAADEIARAGRLVIVIHRKPDGDALGAASAMLAWCRDRGIAVRAFCRDEPPPQYSFLDGIHEFTDDPSVFNGTPLVVVLDAGDLRYAGIDGLLDALPSRPRLLNFDHHADNVLFGDINVVDGTATSACEILHRFHVATASPVSPSVASAILTGILFDTGSLSNPAATQASFRLTAELIRAGGSTHGYDASVLRSKSLPSLRVWGEALSRLRQNDDIGFAATAVYERDLEANGVPEEEVEGLPNFLGRFLDARGVFFLKEMPKGRVKGCFRTREEIDVSIPARLLGGGGHKKAAGFTVSGRIIEGGSGFRIEPPAGSDRPSPANPGSSA